MINKRGYALAATSCLLILSPLTAAQEDAPKIEEEDSIIEGVRCLSSRPIRKTEVLDDQNILFYIRGTAIYLNHLPKPCKRLAKEGRFMASAEASTTPSHHPTVKKSYTCASALATNNGSPSQTATMLPSSRPHVPISSTHWSALSTAPAPPKIDLIQAYTYELLPQPRSNNDPAVDFPYRRQTDDQ